MRKPRVFLVGYDHVGWAHDEDLRLTRQALEGTCEFSTLSRCDVVHSSWWKSLLPLPRDLLQGKRIICHTSDDPYLQILGLPEYRATRQLVGLWVTRNDRETRILDVLGFRSVQIPLMIDVSMTHPLGRDDQRIAGIVDTWKIPRGGYLIGSFQRDTEGHDLTSPKLKKGPDILAELASQIWRRGYPIHVVLAGPRRFWICQRLTELGVPFMYIGQPAVDGDDLPINTLSRPQLNVLYNLVDLCVVTSRYEGAPDMVLAAAAARCKIISTPVGTAPDILDPACLYRSLPEAVELVARDIDHGELAQTVDRQFQRIMNRHRPETVAPLLRAVYDRVHDIPAVAGRPVRAVALRARTARVVRITRRLLSLPRRRHQGLTVGFWHRFVTPPYGGGNQFMLALKRALQARGFRVVENTVHGVDVHILQGIGFNVKRFRSAHARLPMKVIHRIDGPVHLYRGFDRDKDEEVFRLNRECATATVVQSAWSLERTVEMGYRPVSPVLIYNAADPAIFHRDGRAAFDRRRKVRLISTAWSNNPRKGGALYKFLDRHLDWTRFEYTFVGRTSEQFENIRLIPPMGSDPLADLLREHDIYIAASQLDPCSNALIEALSCGLPALYRNDGGHPELVGHGGLPFEGERDVLDQLDRLVSYYESFLQMVTPPTMAEVADKYAALIHEVHLSTSDSCLP